MSIWKKVFVLKKQLTSGWFILFLLLVAYVYSNTFWGISVDAAQSSKVEKSFVVLELFTSQGCSSCPSADKLLQKIAKDAEEKQLAIYPLSFHVDYWNYLGWNDPYSDAGGTGRQRQYAEVFKGRGVYTPQLVLNGKKEAVGSNAREVTKLIEELLKEKAVSEISLSLEKSETGYQLSYVYKNAPEKAFLNIALVEKSRENFVPSGENAKNTLSHINVVRSFESLAISKEGKGTRTLSLPKGSNVLDFRVVALIQHASSMEILGATEVSL